MQLKNLQIHNAKRNYLNNREKRKKSQTLR